MRAVAEEVGSHRVPSPGAPSDVSVQASRSLSVGIAALLVAGTVAAYWGVWRHEFVTFDDPGYVEQNYIVQRGLTVEGIRWALGTGAEGNWHPVTWLSHMLDCQLFGLEAGWHHATSLVLHAANALLLFWWLLRATGTVGRSSFVAALFALHPLQVESVAWVSERKNVLSTLFWMLTLVAYLRYVQRPSTARYVLVATFLALGLMAKPMLVTLPFVLLLLDWWPLGRMAPTGERWSRPGSTGRLLLEKMPLLGLVAASSVVTYAMQARGGAVRSLEVFPIGQRVANALLAYVDYIRKLVWPTDLAAFYPYPTQRPALSIVAAGAMLALATTIAIAIARRFPPLFVGWFWYLGTLVPVIGLVQVGSQAMSDRYAYVPAIGLFVALAWGTVAVLSARRRSPVVLWALGILAVAASVWVTREQVGHWQDTTTLFRHALEVTDRNYLAHHMLGVGLAKQGRPLEESIAQYREALRIKPRFSATHNNLGVARAQQGRLEEALGHFHQAVEIDPGNVEAYRNLGATLGQAGELDQAVHALETAVRLEPDDPQAHTNLAFILSVRGRGKEALAHYADAMRVRPGWTKPIVASVWLLATYPDLAVRDGERAVVLAEAACATSPHAEAGTLDALAAAYAETGRFADAVATAEKAVQIATRDDHRRLAEQIRSRLALYRQGHPVRGPDSGMQKPAS